MAVEVARHEPLSRKLQAMHPIVGKTIPGSFSDPPHISTRLLRGSPLHRRHKVRPRYLQARSASLRAMAPAVIAFLGYAAG
jgi:hypothetical protein